MSSAAARPRRALCVRRHGGGHTTWTCRACDQTVFGPPLNKHCHTLDGPAAVRIANRSSSSSIDDRGPRLAAELKNRPAHGDDDPEFGVDGFDGSHKGLDAADPQTVPTPGAGPRRRPPICTDPGTSQGSP